MNKKFVIWDLDNCLSDDSDRISSIEWNRDGGERWENYHLQSMFDTVNPKAYEVFHKHRWDGLVPIIFTGRPSIYWKETEQWLRKNVTHEPILKMMRAPSDLRGSTTMKKAMLEMCIGIGLFGIEDVVAAYDDRQPIIDMYKEAGIRNATLLQANKLCAYTDPATQKTLED